MTQNYWYIKAKTTEELESAPIFKVRVGKSKSEMMGTTANVVHVENLSERIKANRDYLLRNIRGANILNL